MSRCASHRRSDDGGQALVLVLLITAMVMVMAATSVSITASNIAPARPDADTQAAPAAAQGGVDEFGIALGACGMDYLDRARLPGDLQQRRRPRRWSAPTVSDPRDVHVEPDQDAGLARHRGDPGRGDRYGQRTSSALWSPTSGRPRASSTSCTSPRRRRAAPRSC